MFAMSSLVVALLRSSLVRDTKERLLEGQGCVEERETPMSGDLRVGHLRRRSAMIGWLGVVGGGVAEDRRCTRAR
jgi:hypothetical protein